MSRFLLLAGVLLLAGCGKGNVDAPEAEGGSRDETRIDVKDLHGKSREQQAELEREWAEKVRLEETDLQRSRDDRPFLGTTRFPSIVPIWQQATWSAEAGFSLPPYLKAGEKDGALAWHLARYGDLEAARKIAPAADLDKFAEMHQGLYDRNYPVEWTRLIARTIQIEQLRLVQGSRESADEIASIHQQLRKLLSAKEQSSPLGAALLPMGKRALEAARAAWVKEGEKELAQKTAEALSSWGEVPAPVVNVVPGAPRPLLDRLWGGNSEGRCVVASSAARALDLTGLPVPRSGVEAVVALLDDADQVNDLVVTYRPKLSVTLPSTSNVAHDLEERGLSGRKGADMAGVRQATYSLAGHTCQILLGVANSKLGALVRFHRDTAPEKTTALGRDFGAVHLDASFEQNRLRVSPDRVADSLTIKDAESLGLLRYPLTGLELREAGLSRVKDSVATERLVLKGTPEAGALHAVAGTLFGRLGLGTIEAATDDEGGHLAFVWEDAKTRYILRVPNSASRGYEFEASNRAAGSPSQASAFDLAQRKARLDAGKPWAVLPRALDPVAVELGMSREEAEKLLPKATKTSFGLRQVFPIDPAARSALLPRQLLVRFDGEGRVGEVRLLVFERAENGQDLLARLAEKYGKTGESALRWGALSGSRSGDGTKGSASRWLDDRTIMTVERTGPSAEWVLRDRPKDQPEGIALAPLEFCPRGVAGCQLGDEKEAIVRHWKGAVQKKDSADPLVLVPEMPAEFDALFVWFEGGKAARLLARHARPKDRGAPPVEMAKAVEIAWARLLPTVGCWLVRDLDAGEVAGCSVMDDRTVLRIFWQGEQGTPRVFTEWRESPPVGSGR